MKAKDLLRPVDPLGEALQFLRMNGSLYCSSELTAPWALDMPVFEDCLMFHVVTAGECWLAVPGLPARRLRPGELALVPPGKDSGTGHVLCSDPGVPAVRLFDLPRQAVSERHEVLRHGGGGAATRIVCGLVRFENPAAYRLVSLLPGLLILEADDPVQAEWMQPTLRLMAVEAAALRPGGEMVVTRLADLLVVQAIRSWMARDPAAQTGWLGALQDKQVGRALALIHRDPARAWTVASLAAEVAMSRSAFAGRFSARVGEPVMQYLARWRMHLALMQLREDDLPLGDLASRHGYQSEAAFSRAFKRVVGVSPGSARQASRGGVGRRGG